MSLATGTRLGSYEILAPLGAGGMGEVYRARDLRLGRDVAIKVLPPDHLTDETRRRRFVQEAQAASALNHPHIVTIHEIESDSGSDFIVMEYVRGRSLDALIPRHGLRRGEVLRIATPVAQALAAAHARGIVHRDLKPANVMVGTDGAVKVLDFGLAKLVDRDGIPDETTFTIGTDAALSAPGTIAGTAAYMSPEQALGGVVDARSDIFSFGAMLYEMATGVRAFAGPSTADTLAAVIRAQPKAPSELVPSLPRELERLILRCLRKEPERRYQAMVDVSLELQEIKEESDSGRLPGTATAPAKGRRDIRWPVAGGVIALTVVASTGWVLMHRPGPVLPAPTLVSLTALQGLEFHPTFSPDGDQVAFAWNGEREDNWDIYLKLVDSSEIRRLTTDPGDDSTPTWSPDGRQIAFLRDVADTRALYLVSPVTGTEHKVMDLGSISPAVGWYERDRVAGLSWSHDARWVAVARTIPGQPSSIDLLPTEGGEPKTVITATPPEYYGFPSFSPDGRSLAFASCMALFRCQLRLLELNASLQPNTPARTLVETGDVRDCCAWSRDGRTLVYKDRSYLLQVPSDGSRRPERIELAGIDAREPTGALAANRLAFVQEKNTFSIHPLDMTFESAPVLASSASDFDVKYSPDGGRLAFTSTRFRRGAQIWIARADGSEARQLAGAPGSVAGSPDWSPDGRQIAFDFREDDGTWNIYVVDANGGAPRRFTAEAGDENSPVWSRDGRWVYYTSDQKAGRNVWRSPAAGGRPARVTSSGSGYRMALSPDGSEVLYWPRVTGPAPLVAAPAGGGGTPRQVLPCAADFTATPHGIYYVKCGPGAEHDVHVVEAATKQDRVVGRTSFVDTEMTVSLTVSPDGKMILVPRRNQTADLMMIENFR